MSSTHHCYPHPLQGAGWGLKRLPATSLSAVSIIALLLIPAALQSTSSLRQGFEPPWPPTAASGAAAGLTLIVLLVGSLRPGPTFPRLWALVLLVANGAVLGLAISSGATPWIHALSCGSLGASLALGFRLARPNPMGGWIWRLGPLTLGLVMLLYLPLVWWAGRPSPPEAPPVERSAPEGNGPNG